MTVRKPIRPRRDDEREPPRRSRLPLKGRRHWSQHDYWLELRAIDTENERLGKVTFPASHHD